MKKLAPFFGLLLVSSTVLASAPLKLETYDCGLEIGKAITTLSGTSVAQDATNLAEDLSNYASQSRLALTIKNKTERRMVEQAARNSWQSIVYSLEQIKTVAPQEVTAINAACDLGFEE